MAYTAQQLITDAWYLSSIVSRNYEVVTGDQISDGLNLINRLLDMKTVDISYIPYYQEYDFELVIGQEKYFIPGLVYPETFTFNIGTVRYPAFNIKRKEYFSSGRIDDIQSLPFNYHFERTQGGSDIYLYFLPEGTFLAKIWGKFSLLDVVLNQDLTLTLDGYYIEYLRYELAEYMCAEYGVTFQPQQKAILERYRKIVMRLSAPDLSIQKLSAFPSQNGLTFGDVNLGKGWRPA